MKDSSFFITIYENEKEIYKKYKEYINQVELKFNELKQIFSNQTLNSLKKDILFIYFN